MSSASLIKAREACKSLTAQADHEQSHNSWRIFSLPPVKACQITNHAANHSRMRDWSCSISSASLTIAREACRSLTAQADHEQSHNSWRIFSLPTVKACQITNHAATHSRMRETGHAACRRLA